MVRSIKQFRYVMPGQGSAFGINTSSLDKLKTNREKLGAAMSSTQSILASISNSFAQAEADRISGMANLAAQAGLDRINAARKVQSEKMLKQVDSVQASIDQSKIEAELKKKYYVYTIPAVPLVTVDTEA